MARTKPQEPNSPPAMAVNSYDFWQHKFQAAWEHNDGKAQTQYFMRQVLALLPPFVHEFLARPGARILDWGCALGQGAYELANAFPQAEVSGLDFSDLAVGRARALYPRLAFRSEPLAAGRDCFDAIVTSNCLEHFEYPVNVVREHLACARQLYILLVPYREAEPIHEEHALRLDEQSFPPVLGDFVQAQVSVFDAAPSGFWNGLQMMVVYCSKADPQAAALLERFMAEANLRNVDQQRELLGRQRMLARDEQEAAALLGKLEAAWRELETLRRDKERAEAELERQTEALAHLNGNGHDTRRVLEQFEEESRRLQAELERLGGQAAAQERERQDLLAQLEKAWADSARLRAEGEEALQAREQAHLEREQAAALAGELAALREQLGTLAAERQQLMERHAGELEALSQRLASQQEAHAAAQHEREELAAREQAAQAEAARLGEQLAALGALERELATAREENRGLMNRLEAALAEHEDLDHQRQDLAAQVEAQGAQLNTEAARQAELQAELTNAKTQAARLEAELARLAKLQAELAQAQARIGQLEQIERELNTQFARLEAEREEQLKQLAANHRKQLERQKLKADHELDRLAILHRQQAIQFEQHSAQQHEALAQAERRAQDVARQLETLREASHQATLALERQLAETQAERRAHAERAEGLAQERAELERRLEVALTENGRLGEQLAQQRESLRLLTERPSLGARCAGAARRGLHALLHPRQGLARAYYLGRDLLIKHHYNAAMWLVRRLRGLRPDQNPFMSWYAFAFDQFKRRRMALYEPDLSDVRCPTLPGFVSVVLPVYNGADMVVGSIESVLAQTYEYFELIVINDGSTDNTAEVLESLRGRDKRLRIVHQENQKLPRTLSNGFRLARGEYLTWTSDDNLMKPDFLEKMVGSLRAQPQKDMVYANVDIIDADGSYFRNSSWYTHYQVPPGSEHIHLPEDVSELNIWANNYVGSAFMYRDRVAHLIGDYSAIRFTCEDYDYWMRVNEMFALRHTEFREPVYDYRFHPKSLTSRDKELKITESRGEMMVFDDFRRDFLFYPILWAMDEPQDKSSRHFYRRLRGRLSEAGHMLVGHDCPYLPHLPRLWSPAVSLTLRSDLSALPAPPELPPHIMKVLVYTGEGTLPAEGLEGWDLCVATSAQVEPVALTKPFQGWLVIPDIESFFTALDIRVKSEGALALENELARGSGYEPLKATVIICTYKRSAYLRNAIESACRQDFPRGEYEILVVNNAPSQDLSPVVDPLREQYFADDPERLRMIVCPAKGLSFARNAGIAEARGRYMIFIDDDAIAEETLVGRIVKGFEENEDIGVIGGKILLKDPEPKPWWFRPEHRSFWSHFEPGYNELTRVDYWWEWPWGANWCARRRALLLSGGFRCKYGRVGKDFGGGEEVAASSLVKQLGYKIAIDPEARVIHDVEPSRFTLKGLRRTILAGTHVNYQLQKDLYIPIETTFHYTFHMGLMRTKSALAALKRGDRVEARQHAYFALAQFSLCKRFAKDYYRRLMTPISVKEPWKK